MGDGVKLILVTAVVILMSIGIVDYVCAQRNQTIVLTPTALYDYIERVEKKSDARAEKTLKALLNANQRIQQLEKRVAVLEKKQ